MNRISRFPRFKLVYFNPFAPQYGVVKTVHWGPWGKYTVFSRIG